MVLFGLAIIAGLAQSGNVQFGQNKVQYKEFKWQYYETEHFNIYFYKGGQDLGKYAIMKAEENLEEVVRKLDFRLDKKIDILVYQDISDVNQTNIGIKLEDELISGTTKILENKIFIYFDGDHRSIDEQIKEGLARIFIEKMMVGSSFQEIVSNAVLLNLPTWYVEGLILYTSKYWNADLENKLKDGILSGRYRDLSKLSKEELTFVGHSVWNYLELEYGAEAVPNVLYLTRINRSMDRGILFVTGKKLDSFLSEWYYFYLDRFNEEQEKQEAIDVSKQIAVHVKKHKNYYQTQISPNSKWLAYVENDMGRYKVRLIDRTDEQKKSNVIFKAGFKTNTQIVDYAVPLLAWDNRSQQLTILFEKRDKIYTRNYNVETKKLEKKNPIRNFQKIFGFDYTEDNRHFIFSAMQRGQTDLFVVSTTGGAVKQLTDDFYDDLQPKYAEISGRKGYLFISNRQTDSVVVGRIDSILPAKTFDVYFYDINDPLQRFIQISNTPHSNESFPQAFNENQFIYLSDVSGTNNEYIGTFKKEVDRYIVEYAFYLNDNTSQMDTIYLSESVSLDSVWQDGTNYTIVSEKKIPRYKTVGSSYAATNYDRSIQEITVSNEYVVERIYREQQEQYFQHRIDEIDSLNIVPATTAQEKDTQEKRSKYVNETGSQLSIDIEEEDEPLSSDSTDNHQVPVLFQSQFDGLDQYEEYTYVLEKSVPTKEEENTSAYQLSKTRQYFLRFYTEDITFGLDNSMLISSYQPFNPLTPVYSQPPINSMIRYGITNLFEDHKIHGGIRIPFDFNTSEVYVTYENFKKRLDKSITYYRRANSEDVSLFYPSLGVEVPGTASFRTNLVEAQFNYPIDVINSIRFRFGFRNERTIVKATDFLQLNTPNQSDNWLISRVEFVHDHTLQQAMNIRFGLRFNTFFEFQKEIPTRQDSIFGDVRIQLPEFNNSYLMSWGFDVRHYQQIYKTIVWANRVAYTTSVGTKKLIYYLGGTDNPLFASFNQETPINTENNYAFQALAYNMRGFDQNIRNGNSFVVFNSELRVPLFSAFSRSPSKSALLEHFQWVTFIDIGTAWEGANPFSNDNPLFENVLYNAEDPDQATAIARLNVYKNPIVFGYGTGVRLFLLGYFIRTDVAWSYDSGERLGPKLHFSLGMDF